MIAFARRAARLPYFAAALAAACTDHPSGPAPLSNPQRATPYIPHTRIYYLAAEDTSWNYAPLGRDPVYDRALPAPWGTATVYAKAHYVQYSDSTFTTRIPQPEWQGILGPMIRGVVGDTLKVVFHNRTSQPLSIHPHGWSPF